jgi:ribosome-binding protein aMBF1 (putative translation factor)
MAAVKKTTHKSTQVAQIKNENIDRETRPATEPPISAVIRRMAREHGLNQEALADALRKVSNGQIGRAAVGRWFRGETTPELTWQVALANLFGITLDQLHGEVMMSKERRTVEIFGQTLDQIDETLKRSVEAHLLGGQILSTYPRIRNRITTLRPDVMVEDDNGPVLAVFIMQGGQNAALNVVGLAQLWHMSEQVAPLYVGWINHGIQSADFEPLVDEGYVQGFEIVQGEEVEMLTAKGVIFSNLRAQLKAALAPKTKKRTKR